MLNYVSETGSDGAKYEGEVELGIKQGKGII